MRRLVGLAIVGLATLAPTWALGDDQTIAQDILHKLQVEKQEGHLKGFGIDLQVEDGTVHLKGNVASAAQKKLVQDIAHDVDGVESVVNELEVKASAKKPSATKVTTATNADHALPAVPKANAKPTEARAPKTAAKPSLFAKISNDMANGLRPKSTVSRKSESQLVSHVDQDPAESEPEIEPVPLAAAKPAVSADAIVQQIAGRLQKEKQAGNLRGFNVDLQCDNGTVWVSGHVASQDQHALVIDIARRTKGVTQVVNDLKVGAHNATPTGHTGESIPVAEGTGVARPNATRVAPAPQVEAFGAAQPIQLPGNLKLVPISPAPGQLVPTAGQRGQTPLAFAQSSAAGHLAAQPGPVAMNAGAQPMPAHMAGPNVGIAPARYDHPNLPGYAWPSYASHPNYAAVSYPKQYSASAWPYIGPFYPYPQVPLGWRKVMLEWDDGWWFLDFKDK